MRKREKKCETCNAHIKPESICVGINSKYFGHTVTKGHWCRAWEKISEEKTKLFPELKM